MQGGINNNETINTMKKHEGNNTTGDNQNADLESIHNMKGHTAPD